VETVLWSGGFDSTALVLERLRRGETVRPVYMAQRARWQKQIRERDAMDRIRSAIAEPRLLRLVEWPAFNTSIEPHVRALDELNGGDWTTVQNAALAAVADDVGPIAAALVADDYTATQRPVVGYLRRHRVALPVIASTKRDVLRVARDHGYAELLELTWSCEGRNTESRGLACGRCEPCRHRIVEQRVRAS
jgi:hypothetical protein